MDALVFVLSVTPSRFLLTAIMTSSWVVGLVGAVLPAAALALSSDTNVVQQHGLIRFPVIPQAQSVPAVAANNTRRQITLGSTVHQSTYYTIPLVFGTPGQSVPVLIDTGSSELWANPTCSKSGNPTLCASQQRFTYSTTLVDLGALGSINYRSGYASFVYVSDYVGVGSE